MQVWSWDTIVRGMSWMGYGDVSGEIAKDWEFHQRWIIAWDYRFYLFTLIIYVVQRLLIKSIQNLPKVYKLIINIFQALINIFQDTG